MPQVKENEVITIYHIEGRKSLRAIWLCEELDIPYKLVFQQGDIMGSMAMLRAVNPLMPIVPTVKYRGRILVESGAILELLQTRHGKGRLAPSIESDDYPAYLMWMHFSEGTAGYRIWAYRFAAMVANVPVEGISRGHAADAEHANMANLKSMLDFVVGTQAVFDFMEQFLIQHPWFGGKEFSAADIMMWFSYNSAKLTAGFDTQNFPRIQAWRKGCEARPAFKRALDNAVPGGYDEYGLPKDMPLPFETPKGEIPVPSVLTDEMKAAIAGAL